MKLLLCLCITFLISLTYNSYAVGIFRKYFYLLSDLLVNNFLTVICKACVNELDRLYTEIYLFLHQAKESVLKYIFSLEKEMVLYGQNNSEYYINNDACYFFELFL